MTAQNEKKNSTDTEWKDSVPIASDFSYEVHPRHRGSKGAHEFSGRQPKLVSKTEYVYTSVVSCFLNIVKYNGHMKPQQH